MFHPYALTYGYVDEPLDGNHGPPLCLWSQEFYETDPKRDFVRGYTFQFGRGVGVDHGSDRQFGNAGRLPWGEDHHSVYRRLVNHRIELSAICEDLPEEHNRVTLDPVLKDSERHSGAEARLHHQRQQPEDDGPRHRPRQGGADRRRRQQSSAARARS